MENIVDLIVGVLAQVCLGLSIVALYVFLVAYLLPGKMLKPGYDLSVMKDRGIQKYVFAGGRAIVYEASVQSGRYIKQYILSDNQREKYIRCKIDKQILSIVYDVIAMDANDRVIDIVQVSEPILQSGITSGALLPPKTSYVSVVVKAVNGRRVEANVQMRLPKESVVKYTAWTVACTVVQGVFLNNLIVHWFDIGMRNFVSEGLMGYVIRLPFYVLAGLFVAAVTVLCYRSKEVRVRK